MTTPHSTIPFDDFRDQLGTIFDAIGRDRRPVIVERDGVLYRLEPQLQTPPLQTSDPHDIWRNYDPKKVREAMRQAAGVLAGVDRDELLRDIHQQREQDSTGRPAD